MLTCEAQTAPANNQKGAEVTYQLMGDLSSDNPGAVYYHFVLKMVVECSSGAPGVLPLFVHNISENKIYSYDWAFDSASNKVSVADPCIAFSSAPCYRIYYYYIDAPLPFNNGGYLVFYGDCCRNDYQNLRTTFNASPLEGAKLGTSWSAMDPVRPGSGYIYNSIAYQFTIPARGVVNKNSSPAFNSNSDTVLYVCTGTRFSHTFSAYDPDGDSLVYTFAPSKIFYTDGSQGMVSIHTSAPPDAAYNGPAYSATLPLGEGVDIDSKTGTVSGQLPDTGSYMLTVGVYEYRAGKLVTSLPHTRDVVVKAYDCSKLPVPQAILPPLINDCDSTTLTIPNKTTPYNPSVYWDNNTYLWDLGDGDTSHVRNPVHTYDTGTYNLRLITMAGYRCADTAYSKLLVYPSVHPSFIISGNSCTGQPVKFTNTSTTDIGAINTVRWTFVNTKDSSEYTSVLNNPLYTFTQADRTYAAILDVTTTKGCDAKDTQYLNVSQSPLPLQSHDTVLAAGVPYKLYANSGYDTTGSIYIWSPSTGLDDPFSASPIATNTEDITYKVQVSNQFGCSITDTVHIKYYKGPDIYMPQAFTPNGDGTNDVLRPVPVGIQKLDYFRVFDRWGNTVYQTQTYLAGWDGNVAGKQASAGTYIYEVGGKDYNNKPVSKKGYVLLIR